MDAVLGQYLTPTVILANDATQAREIAARLRREVAVPPLSEMIQTVRTIDDVLPSDQPAKVEEAAKIRDDMTPRMRSLVPAADRVLVDPLLDERDPGPIGVADLPHRFTTAMLERDGTIGRTVLVYPRKSPKLWEGPGIAAFTQALRDAAAGAGRASGEGGRDRSRRRPTSSTTSATTAHRASVAALLGVVIVVVLLFRWRETTAYVLGTLSVGVLWLAAATMALGVKINFANFIAFPITFGIGVDYPVNLVSRWSKLEQQRRWRGRQHPTSGTAKGTSWTPSGRPGALSPSVP